MTFSEIINILPWILFLLAAYVLSRFGIQWRVKRACLYILRDLQSRGAVTPLSAVELRYAKRNPFQVGLRDFRPRALEDLTLSGIIGRTDEGKFYLIKDPKELQL